LVAAWVEVAAPLEWPAVWEPAAEEDSAAEEDAAEEDSAALELPVADAVAVGVALVSAGAELEELDSLALALEALVVAIGGTEMGWPAEEHWATTALETARENVSWRDWLGMDLN
jgi:hypothetical protein